jgi:hypothetical protein
VAHNAEFWTFRHDTTRDDPIFSKVSAGGAAEMDLGYTASTDGTNTFTFGMTGQTALTATHTYNDRVHSMYGAHYSHGGGANWRHWAVTYDSATKRRSIYLHGFHYVHQHAFNNPEDVGLAKWCTTTYGNCGRFENYVADGSDVTSSISPTGNMFVGMESGGVNFGVIDIDELRIWDIARSAYKISTYARYEFDVAPHLVASLQFDDPSDFAKVSNWQLPSFALPHLLTRPPHLPCRIPPATKIMAPFCGHVRLTTGMDFLRTTAATTTIRRHTLILEIQLRGLASLSSLTHQPKSTFCFRCRLECR